MRAPLAPWEGTSPFLAESVEPSSSLVTPACPSVPLSLHNMHMRVHALLLGPSDKLRPHARDCVQAGVSVVPQHEYLSIRAAAIVPISRPPCCAAILEPPGGLRGDLWLCGRLHGTGGAALRHLAPPPTRTRAPSPALATRLHGTERILRALVPCLEPTVYLMQSFPTSLCLPLRARRPPPRAPARHPFCAAAP